jgi:hypothetical protein
VLWAGTVRFADDPVPGGYRILITHYEQVAHHGRPGATHRPARMVYAESCVLDDF